MITVNRVNVLKREHIRELGTAADVEAAERLVRADIEGVFGPADINRGYEGVVDGMVEWDWDASGQFVPVA